MTRTKTFFTSDWHLFHNNIIKYSARPFQNVQEMNQTILDRLNERVGPDDWLYFLGDMAFTTESNLIHWLNSVKCKNICVIKGNHDKTASRIQNRFFWFRDYAEIVVNNQPITLCHYAMRVWNKSHRGAWQLYGHSHGSLLDDPNALNMDVGVDTNNFYPYSFEEIQQRMSKKVFKPIDHHS